MYSKEQVHEASLKYFDGDELASSVIDKYLLRDNEGNYLEKTPDEKHRRIAKEFARIEKDKFKNPLTEEFIFSLLDRYKYIVPQGSPMFGIGNNYQTISLSNCYLLDLPLDSYSSILEIDQQLVNISKRRGGCGIDLSNLRPRGTRTRNAAGTATGIVSWMERYSNSIREVGQNGRRGALMLTLDVHHPDILDFCTIKNDSTKVTGANISVRSSQEFVDALENDGEYELRFPVDYKEKGVQPTFSKFVKAKEVWDIIIHSAWLRAEPGILAWYNTVKNTPADYYEEYRSRGTNPCSEINLSPLDSCRLLCLNLYSYVVNPFTPDAYFDYNKFFYHAQIAQRLMDDLVDLESEKIQHIIKKVESDPEPYETKRKEIEMWEKIKKFNDEGRRTGTGITALGDTLAALGIKYGSEESIKTTESIYHMLKYGCYYSSVEMAKEIGPFKCWDWEKEKNCPFFEHFSERMLFVDGDKTIPLLEAMQKYGRRNIALTTTAPTGSVSILTQTTSGIEPLFMIGYTRRRKINHNEKDAKVDFVDQSGDAWEEFTVYHPKVKEWMKVTGETDITKSPWYGCCAEEIDWINRVKLQAAAQKHVCHAISSTINLPEDATKELIAKIYLTAFKLGCKGMTVYRKNCRTGVLIETTEKEDVLKDAPKRPKKLPCDVYTAKLDKKNHFIVVGLLDNKPYEIFVGKGDFNILNGFIIKVKRGHYQLLNTENEVVSDNICGKINHEQEIVTRLISTSLRHNIALPWIVQQLHRTDGDLHSLYKVIARFLKKYIADGEKAGEECPNCKGQLAYQEGCVRCLSGCGFSKCG